jgi:hypothetical protein
MVRAEVLDLRQGSANPTVYSLQKAGGDVLGIKIGSQYYRRAAPEDVAYQSLRLRIEIELQRCGYRFLRPVHYNSKRAKPKLTPQSKLIITMIIKAETDEIDAGLRRIVARGRSTRWDTQKREEPSYLQAKRANMGDINDPVLRDWIETEEENKRLRMERTEEYWSTWGVYSYIYKRGLLNPRDVPEALIERIIGIKNGQLFQDVPRRLNTYVAWRAGGQPNEVPILIELCRADITRAQVTKSVATLSPLASRFPAVFVFGAGATDSLTASMLRMLLDRNRIAAVSIDQWAAYLQGVG